MKKLKRTYTRCALTASLVLLVLLVAGSIWDLPISKFLYPGHESSLGHYYEKNQSPASCAAGGHAVRAAGRLRRSADRPPRQVPPGTERYSAGVRRLSDPCKHVPCRS